MSYRCGTSDTRLIKSITPPVRLHRERLPTMNRLIPLVAITGVVCFTTSVTARLVDQAFKLVANDGAAGDELGRSIDQSGNTIAAGSPNDDERGAVYLFDAGTGTQTGKLVADDGEAGDRFGISVAIADGIVAVGAPGQDAAGTNAGAVYLFDASTGVQLAKLIPDDPGAGDEFGNAVTISDGIVAVGSWRADELGDNSGVAHLFDASTGSQLHKLLPDTGNANQSFGVSIAMDDGIVAVGARTYFVLGEGYTFAKVYLFDASTGSQVHRLRADIENYNGDLGGGFGDAVDIQNGLVAVGAPFRSVFFDFSGAAYVFNASTGDQLRFIFPADGHDRDHFGASIAIDDGVLAIGANEDDDSASAAGSAYLFDALSGSQIDKLLANDGVASDELGVAIAINSDTVVVGAPGVNDQGENSGSVYVFNDDPTTCRADLDGDGALTIFDFLEFQNLFDSGDPEADFDGDGELTLFDFLAFQNEFDAGCP
ncbi:MAG: hypothetical protein NCW75_13260 [Phycisphaera sp.]|nr:MAG: hypothetical protein NCW75_13260 [Phycisphaera sp.]